MIDLVYRLNPEPDGAGAGGMLAKDTLWAQKRSYIRHARIEKRFEMWANMPTIGASPSLRLMFLLQALAGLRIISVTAMPVLPDESPTCSTLK
jgi:hypothetical protein